MGEYTSRNVIYTDANYYLKMIIICRISMLTVYNIIKNKVYSFINFKGTDPKFWSKIAIFFFAEKASSGMWEICPKILGGYEY